LKNGSRGSQRLRVRNAARGAEDAKKLIALRRMRPKTPSFWKIMAQEMTENIRRSAKTPRATSQFV